MTARSWSRGLREALTAVRWRRLAAILMLAAACGLLCDWLRKEGGLLTPSLPRFTTVPAQR